MVQIGRRAADELPPRAAVRSVCCSAARVSPLKLSKGGVLCRKLRWYRDIFALLLYAGGRFCMKGVLYGFWLPLLETPDGADT